MLAKLLFDICIYLGLLFDADANGMAESLDEGLDLGHLEGGVQS